MNMHGQAPSILWLGHPDCNRREWVGGKAANLSRLAAAYPVPPGFCLTTTAFQAGATPSQTGVSFDGLTDAYQVLAKQCNEPNPSVAVRSSAVDEDGSAASFAGQFESYLNVMGIEAIMQAIGFCWASANSERIQSYRQQLGLAIVAPLAVLVQKLIAADVSAVVFSANPVSNDSGEIVINASWGLGESIVGGTVTPDTYTVSKSSLALTSTHIADKAIMSVHAEAGTREVTVPRMLRTQPSLNESQVLEVTQLALRLEQEMGWPVDMECAYQAEQLFLLQCRPITTLGVSD